MVLLDEIKTKEEPKQRSRGQKIVRWIWRIVFTLLVITCLTALALATIGRSEQFRPLVKQGWEEFFSLVTGTVVEMETLDDIGLFPDIKFTARSVTFKKNEQLSSKIDTLRFSMSFWDSVLSRQHLKNLTVEGVSLFETGQKQPYLAIDAVELVEKNDKDQPALRLRGAYRDIKLRADMTVSYKDGKFFLEKLNPLDFSFGPVSGQALFGSNKTEGIFLHDLAVTGAGETTVTGNIALNGAEGERFQLDADMAWQTSRLEAALTYNDALKGRVTFPVLDVDDKDLWGLAIGLYDVLVPPVPEGQAKDETVSLAGLTADMTVEIKKLKKGDTVLGYVTVPLKIADEKMTLGTVKGRLSDGAVDGRVVLSTAKSPATLDAKMNWSQFDYGILQKAFYDRDHVKGSADIRLEVKSAGGDTVEALVSGLNGEAVFIAGQGEMDARAFNLWGGGLINALLPTLDPSSQTTLNCAIADFKIEDGIAQTDPLFVDTKRVTVAGQGKIDLIQSTINVQLKPKAKQVALLDVSPAVNIKGPFTKPAIGVDTLSLGTQLGGLLLGTVNPAFLVFSLTDLGLNEQHPCHQFIAATSSDEKE